MRTTGKFGMQSKFVRNVERRRRRRGGFTLVELLVVAVLVALLALIATPSFVAWHVRDQVDASARALVASLAYAKSEAVRRGARVTLCRIDAERRCLATGRECEDGAVDWSCGWAVRVESRGEAAVFRAHPRVAAVAISGNTVAISL